MCKRDEATAGSRFLPKKNKNQRRVLNTQQIEKTLEAKLRLGTSETTFLVSFLYGDCTQICTNIWSF